jgi:hypothetical protein
MQVQVQSAMMTWPEGRREIFLSATDSLPSQAGLFRAQKYAAKDSKLDGLPYLDRTSFRESPHGVHSEIDGILTDSLQTGRRQVRCDGSQSCMKTMKTSEMGWTYRRTQSPVLARQTCGGSLKKAEVA